MIILNHTGMKNISPKGNKDLTDKIEKVPNDYIKPHWHEKYIIYRQTVTKTSLAQL
jgi:hypothetical protein